MSERAQVYLQAAIVLAVLTAAVFGIAYSAGRPGGLGLGSPAPTGPDESLIASTAPTIIPSPTATPTLEPTPSPTPEPTPVLTAYQFEGRSYTGIELGSEAFVLAPYAAEVEIHVYQMIDGEIREGANVEGVPYFPYIHLDTPDRRLTYRPGELEREVVLIAEPGAIGEGAPIFRLVGTGRSSWASFYDGSIPFQIVMSLVTVPSGNDLDAGPLLVVR